MKKMFFSAVAFAVVAVSAVAVAPTTSEAIPAFARQTGAACLSCHFQTFPTLTAFGRSFKQNAFADMGEQALIEDDALSIPSVLNATVVFRPNISTVKVTGAATVKTITYGDQVVLIGGRIGANAGAFVELGGGAFGNHQLLTSFDMGAGKLGVSYYSTGFSEDAGMALSNVWGQHGAALGGRDVMANQALWNALRTNGAAVAGVGQGAGLTAHFITDMFTIQGGLVAPSDGVSFGGGTFGTTFTAAKMVRGNGFFDVAGMTAMVGGIWVGGNVGDSANAVAAGLAAGTQLEQARWGVDASLEGEMGNTAFGLYVDYANAKGNNGGTKVNIYNLGLNARKGYGVRATVKPLHNVIVGAGYGSMKGGDAVLGDNTKDTTWNVGAEYEIYQNFVIALTYTNAKNTVAGVSSTTKTTLVDIEALM